MQRVQATTSAQERALAHIDRLRNETLELRNGGERCTDDGFRNLQLMAAWVFHLRMPAKPCRKAAPAAAEAAAAAGGGGGAGAAPSAAAAPAAAAAAAAAAVPVAAATAAGARVTIG